MAAARIRELLSELIAALTASDDPAALLLASTLAATAAFLMRDDRGPAALRPLAGTTMGPQWVSPAEAVAEFRLDPVRLARRWKRLDYCAPKIEGGRGFRVDRWALQARLARKPLTRGGIPE